MAGLDTLAYTFFLNPDSLALDALELGENTPEGKVAAQGSGPGTGV